MIELKQYPNYLITSDGNIISCKTNKPICIYVDNVGYYQCVIYVNKKRKHVRVHQLVALAYINNIDNLKMINHKDGNKLNNNADNLEWSTNKDNTKHAYDNNLYLSRKNLEIESVNTVTGEILKHQSIRQCAIDLNVNRKTISSILKGYKTEHHNYTFNIL